MRTLRAWLCSALLATAPQALAHDLDVARVWLTAQAGAGDVVQLQLIAVLPGTAALQAPIRWPAGCSETARRSERFGTRQRLELALQCRPAPPADASAAMPWGQDGLLLQGPEMLEPILLHAADGESVLVPLGRTSPRPWTLAARDYFGLGVQHILEGWDHLAFVLCLCLLLSGWRLLSLVTAFTVGHSVSLALAFLGVVRIPVPPVEAVIALSVAFMAREALLTSGRGAPLLRRHLAVVAGFGLLHGLGFASVLGGLGVAPTERITGLLWFNVGVEVGQLLFCAVVLVVLAAAARVRCAGHGLDVPARFAAAICAGGVALAWWAERTLAMA